MSAPLLEVDLTAGYGKHTILHGVRFTLQAGERLGLVGTSGAGKSTLTLALMALLPWRHGWVQGKVLLEGENLLALRERSARRIRGRRVSLVPQSAMSALNGSLSLQGHFEEAWRAHESSCSALFVRRVSELLQQMKLPGNAGFLARRPGQISVGQAQRVAIALALLHRPALVIADEPTSALDPVTQVEILELLRAAGEQNGTALLYISHDLLSVLQLCERMAVLDAGRIVECLAVAGIEEQARHPATLSLLRTLPVPAGMISAYARERATEKFPADVAELTPRQGASPRRAYDTKVVPASTFE